VLLEGAQQVGVPDAEWEGSNPFLGSDATSRPAVRDDACASGAAKLRALSDLALRP
jgi:hypothetical protein